MQETSLNIYLIVLSNFCLRQEHWQVGSVLGKADTSLFQVHQSTCYGAIALTKFAPFGVPTPVTSSQPTLVISDESVPKVITNQRVENGLL